MVMVVRPDLQLAVQRLGRRRFVVVTDRYPPHAVGGAEVSLHIVLRALGLGAELAVVTFGDSALRARTYRHEGVDVLELPRQGRWPLHTVAHGLEARLGGLPPPIRLLARSTLQRVADSRATRDGAWGFVAEAALEPKGPRGGVPVDAIEWEDGLMARLLRQVLKGLKPSLVHADNYRSIMVTAHAVSGLSLRTVGVVRDNRFHCARYDQSVRTAKGLCERCDFACAAEDDPSSPDRQERLLRATTDVRHDAIRAMTRTVVTSAYLEEQLAKIVDPARIVRIPNTPDEASGADDWMMGVPELPGTNLLVVGMLNENKGQIGLVRGLASLAERVPDVHLHLAGRGPRIEAKLREMLTKSGFTDRVTFHGYVGREGLYALYRQCQIVVLPTLWPEPFGRVPLEAGISRRPVVSFAVGGLRESILDGVTGRLVPAEDYEALNDAIAELADAPGRCREMGERAREHVLQTFVLTDVAARVRDLWATLGD
jgi:glycosyltransferase involved in cell wall biosynthesis